MNAQKINDLSFITDKLLENALKRAEEIKVIAESMSLSEIRRSQNVTQRELAAKMEKEQSTLAKLESKGDFRLSVLNNYISCLGGRLELIVHLENGKTVKLKTDSMNGE